MTEEELLQQRWCDRSCRAELGFRIRCTWVPCSSVHVMAACQYHRLPRVCVPSRLLALAAVMVCIRTPRRTLLIRRTVLPCAYSRWADSEPPRERVVCLDAREGCGEKHSDRRLRGACCQPAASSCPRAHRSMHCSGTSLTRSGCAGLHLLILALSIGAPPPSFH